MDKLMDKRSKLIAALIDWEINRPEWSDHFAYLLEQGFDGYASMTYSQLLEEADFRCLNIEAITNS